MQDSAPTQAPSDFLLSWKRAFDTEGIIEPTIDPTTRKQTFRNVVGVNYGGTRTEVKVRHFDIVATGEPAKPPAA